VDGRDFCARCNSDPLWATEEEKREQEEREHDQAWEEWEGLKCAHCDNGATMNVLGDLRCDECNSRIAREAKASAARAKKFGS
jgi:DNA-directed RNA polymerase subunit RPC12/RpoP